MPPTATSRYAHCEGVERANGSIDLTRRVPYRFRDLNDTRRHTVGAGDTLHSIAHKYFSIPRAAEFWWAIADFQPVPITDPTIKLQPGAMVHVPSTRTLTEKIIGERERRESG